MVLRRVAVILVEVRQVVPHHVVVRQVVALLVEVVQVLGVKM